MSKKYCVPINILLSFFCLLGIHHFHFLTKNSSEEENPQNQILNQQPKEREKMILGNFLKKKEGSKQVSNGPYLR
jgi:hypothetical protein